jgi:hypothetical protein
MICAVDVLKQVKFSAFPAVQNVVLGVFSMHAERNTVTNAGPQTFSAFCRARQEVEWRFRHTK